MTILNLDWTEMWFYSSTQLQLLAKVISSWTSRGGDKRLYLKEKNETKCDDNLYIITTKSQNTEGKNKQ